MVINAALHIDRVVIDYADTTMTAQTLTANFEGLSQFLKEQSAEIKYLGVLTLSNSKIFNF